MSQSAPDDAITKDLMKKLQDKINGLQDQVSSLADIHNRLDEITLDRNGLKKNDIYTGEMLTVEKRQELFTRWTAKAREALA